MPDFDALAARTAAKIQEILQLSGEPRAYLQIGHEFLHEAVPTERQLALSELDGLPSSPALGAPPELGLAAGSNGSVLVGQGHRYLFEGHGMDSVHLPVAAAVRCGVRDVVLVETCLSLRDDLRVGSWLAVTDYVNNLGCSPLAGRLASVTCPFLDMTDVFGQTLNSELVNTVSETCITPRLGVYQADLGPHYATPAEADIARRNEADVIGNAIVPEAVFAAALGCRVAALLLVVGHAATYRGKRHRHSDTMDAAEFCGPPMLGALIHALSAHDSGDDA
jgi:purine-nucleoside phosphorylase